MPAKSQTVLVIDLDDTIYKEADYVLSGLMYVVQCVENLTLSTIRDDVLGFRLREPKGDFLAYICNVAGLPAQAKESLLWLYRLHIPDIKLHPEVIAWVNQCKAEYRAVAILTDGRVITQRLKLQALGLLDVTAYISEEWGSEKPDPIRFIAIQQRWPNSHYVYVADNTRKDFLAPNSLGWTTIGLLDDRSVNIHTDSTPSDFTLLNQGEDLYPRFWVKQLRDVDEIISAQD